MRDLVVVHNSLCMEICWNIISGKEVYVLIYMRGKYIEDEPLCSGLGEERGSLIWGRI